MWQTVSLVQRKHICLTSTSKAHIWTRYVLFVQFKQKTVRVKMIFFLWGQEQLPEAFITFGERSPACCFLPTKKTCVINFLISLSAWWMGVFSQNVKLFFDPLSINLFTREPYLCLDWQTDLIELFKWTRVFTMICSLTDSTGSSVPLGSGLTGLL